MKKILLTGLGALALLTVLAITYMTIAGRDVPKMDLSHLEVIRPEVKDEVNAFTYFLAATNYFVKPTNHLLLATYSMEQPDNKEAVGHLLDDNQAALEQLVMGTRQDICLAPPVVTTTNTMPFLSDWLYGGKLLATKVRYEKTLGDHAQAVGTCVTLLRYGELLQRQPSSLIHHLVGIAIVGMGLHEAEQLVLDPAVDAPLRQTIDLALPDSESLAAGLALAMKAEFHLVIDMMNRIKNRDIALQDVMGLATIGSGGFLARIKIPGFFLKVNQTEAIFAEVFGAIIENADDCYTALANEPVLNKAGFTDDVSAGFFRPNFLGKTFVTLLASPMKHVAVRRYLAESHSASVRLIIALISYEEQFGHLPDTLNQLVPDFLGQIPRDPFDCKPFRYDPNRGIIYSVGSNLTDDGGSRVDPDTHEQTDMRNRAEDVIYLFRTEGDRDRDKDDGSGAGSGQSPES